jgi:hypothetical protein
VTNLPLLICSSTPVEIYAIVLVFMYTIIVLVINIIQLHVDHTYICMYITLMIADFFAALLAHLSRCSSHHCGWRHCIVVSLPGHTWAH